MMGKAVYIVYILCSEIALTILKSLINILRDKKMWLKNAFYYQKCLNFFDHKSQFSVQCQVVTHEETAQ